MKHKQRNTLPVIVNHTLYAKLPSSLSSDLLLGRSLEYGIDFFWNIFKNTWWISIMMVEDTSIFVFGQSNFSMTRKHCISSSIWQREWFSPTSLFFQIYSVRSLILIKGFFEHRFETKISFKIHPTKASCLLIFLYVCDIFF